MEKNTKTNKEHKEMKKILIIGVAVLALLLGGSIGYTYDPHPSPIPMTLAEDDIAKCPCGCGIALGRCGCPADILKG